MSHHMRIRQKRSSKTKPKQAQQADNAISTAAASVASQNERLQRSLISHKLDEIRKQQNQQLLHQQIQTHLGARSLCNGLAAGVNVSFCCDVNCRLNTARLSVGEVGGGGLRPSFVRELSTPNASCSRSSSPCPSTSSVICSRRNASVLTTTSQRDGSPDSGVGSDGGGNSGFGGLDRSFTVNLHLDLFSWLLFALALCTRLYKLATPPNVVFDELHYGKYISLYMRNIFFFDQNPPLGKQLIAGVASLAGFNGNFSYPRIGAEYTPNVPIFWLRLLPALCGSLLAPAVYKLLLETRLSRWTSLLGGLLIVFDNALLTQSRFVLMEPILLLFSTLGICFLLKFQRLRFGSPLWLICGVAAASCLAFAASVKYVGLLSGCLAAYLTCRYLWDLLYDGTVTDIQIALQTLARVLLFGVLPLSIYLGIFYFHLHSLYRAGPHDSIMTSAFQASLEGGLASITKGQPLKVVHGSQITLRHTHGRTCWLHSHAHVYPVRYPDKRGSSHQQQVTCYSFKDVNNWWIVKRPDRDDLVVDDDLDEIRDGDVIQLVHGITSRALNSHDVAAPMTPQCQEVTCYIDYDIKMAGELLWRVKILNKETEGPVWHAIKSQIRLIHETSGTALRFSGRQLPEWGFNQHEVVADRVVKQMDTIWNVEEHRYTKTKNQRDRERQLLSAEMIPTKQTKLTFWEKFLELQTKMLHNSRRMDSHMYSSTPVEWPLMDKGIAYWVDSGSNSQIHLLGNVIIWYTGTISILVYAALYVFYLARRQRLCYDLPPREWQRFREAGDIFFVGYLLHYMPYFFIDRILFLHNYFPALLFKFWLLCFVVEHFDYLLKRYSGKAIWSVFIYRILVLLWLLTVVVVFVNFLPLSYGFQKLSTAEIINLRWKNTWDFLLRKDFTLESAGDGKS